MKRIVRVESWDLARPFRTAKVERLVAQLIVLELHDAGVVGRGETMLPAEHADRLPVILEQLETAPLDREALRVELPPGRARNALDSALWDLEAKRAGKRVWELLGIDVRPVRTMFTIGIDSLEAMEQRAREHSDWPVLKIKAEAQSAVERVEAVRRGAGRSRLVVDANASWTVDDYVRLAPELARLDVSVIEQPLPPELDDELMMLTRPIPVCADESFRVAADVERLAALYDMVNIKLYKSGGLTEALAAASAADEAGMAIMVGCMVSTSLAIAPAWLVAQGAQYVDLDGPLHLAADREAGLTYAGCEIQQPEPELWG